MISSVIKPYINIRMFSTIKIKLHSLYNSTPLQKFLKKNYYLTAAIGTEGPELEVFNDILKSGKFWIDYYNPFSFEKEKEWEIKNIDILKSIDSATKRIENEKPISDGFKTAMSHQYVTIEGYSLGFGDSETIYKSIQPIFANLTNINQMPDSLDEAIKRFINEYPDFKKNIDDIELILLHKCFRSRICAQNG
ncbi:hypothetical protein ACTFIY_004936 [Dictyostelium cf. discoideum]